MNASTSTSKWFEHLSDYLQFRKRPAGDLYYRNPYHHTPLLKCPSLTIDAGTGSNIQYGINRLSLTNPPYATPAQSYLPLPLHKVTHTSERVLLSETDDATAKSGSGYQSNPVNIYERHNKRFSNTVFVALHIGRLNAFKVHVDCAGAKAWSVEPFNYDNAE